MELIAPAGNLEKLKVALVYGADAVYLGGHSFNLRNQSNNFTLEELKKGVKFAHKLNKKVYLTLNASLHEYDKNNIKDYIKELSSIDLDAFIIADIGVFSILKDIIPQANVHISTQANTTNSASCNMWKKLGANRIVMARELSLDEIKEIRNSTDIEIETFVHGAVCMSYSGRCLLSNYMTERDANKGECSQVCRWNFKLYMEEATRPGEFMEVEEEAYHTTILSAKDLQMAAYLHLLKKAGIDSLKIEGRMKSVYYVANVVRVYRKLLDVLERVGSDDYSEVIKKEPLVSYIKELNAVSRRESDTGFFLRGKNNKPNIKPTLKSYLKGRRLLAIVTALENGYAKVYVYNTIYLNNTLIYIGINFLNCYDNVYKLFIKTEDGKFVQRNNIRNVDEFAYIKSAAHNFSEYDIITSEEK